MRIVTSNELYKSIKSSFMGDNSVKGKQIFFPSLAYFRRCCVFGIECSCSRSSTAPVFFNLVTITWLSSQTDYLLRSLFWFVEHNNMLDMLEYSHYQVRHLTLYLSSFGAFDPGPCCLDFCLGYHSISGISLRICYSDERCIEVLLHDGHLDFSPSCRCRLIWRVPINTTSSRVQGSRWSTICLAHLGLSSALH